MNQNPTPSLNQGMEEYTELLAEVTGIDNALKILRAAQTENRLLTDEERETVSCAACRLAGSLLDAVRTANQNGEDPGIIAKAEAAADELIKLVNRLNGFGEGEEE